MSDLQIVALAGILCGLLAGGAAQYGRLCTFGAIEDALIAHDYRRARAFGLAIAVAILLAQALDGAGFVDLGQSLYAGNRLELLSLCLGAMMFGLGMSLVGTCGFGMLVRLGTGDLRALVSALVLGIAAFAITGGVLAPMRLWLDTIGVVDMAPLGGASLPDLLATAIGRTGAWAIVLALPVGLALWALMCPRTRRKWRLLTGGAALGLAVVGGWIATGVLADPFGATRLESLTFVAPIGRLILLAMGQSVASATFAIATVIGVAAGSLLVTATRDELRWEAFDDQREMRRHLTGALLMGLGGVMAGGCTIGQGISAASTLAISAPIAIVFMILGARLGLYLLIAKPQLAPRWLRRRRKVFASR